MILGTAGEVEFDSLYRAHLSVQSDTPVRTASDLYKKVQIEESMHAMVMMVEPNEMYAFVQELGDEIRMRKLVLQKYNYMRANDFKSKGEPIPDTLREAFVTLLLPRSISNINLKMLDEILCKTVPLNIHFITIIPSDIREEIKERVEANSYWIYNEDEGTLQHK